MMILSTFVLFFLDHTRVTYYLGKNNVSSQDKKNIEVDDNYNNIGLILNFIAHHHNLEL
jgi:hypothetical protein